MREKQRQCPECLQRSVPISQLFRTGSARCEACNQYLIVSLKLQLASLTLLASLAALIYWQGDNWVKDIRFLLLPLALAAMITWRGIVELAPLKVTQHIFRLPGTTERPDGRLSRKEQWQLLAIIMAAMLLVVWLI